MSGRSEPTPPSAGPGAGTPCNDPTKPCPLGNLIVHVRRDTAAGPVVQGATVTITGPENGSGTTDATDKAEFKKIQPGT
jgi:hypothetical protein